MSGAQPISLFISLSMYLRENRFIVVLKISFQDAPDVAQDLRSSYQVSRSTRISPPRLLCSECSGAQVDGQRPGGELPSDDVRLASNIF